MSSTDGLIANNAAYVAGFPKGSLKRSSWFTTPAAVWRLFATAPSRTRSSPIRA